MLFALVAMADADWGVLLRCATSSRRQLACRGPSPRHQPHRGVPAASTWPTASPDVQPRPRGRDGQLLMPDGTCPWWRTRCRPSRRLSAPACRPSTWRSCASCSRSRPSRWAVAPRSCSCASTSTTATCLASDRGWQAVFGHYTPTLQPPDGRAPPGAVPALAAGSRGAAAGARHAWPSQTTAAARSREVGSLRLRRAARARRPAASRSIAHEWWCVRAPVVGCGPRRFEEGESLEIEAVLVALDVGTSKVVVLVGRGRQRRIRWTSSARARALDRASARASSTTSSRPWPPSTRPSSRPNASPACASRRPSWASAATTWRASTRAARWLSAAPTARSRARISSGPRRSRARSPSPPTGRCSTSCPATSRSTARRASRTLRA